MTSQRGESAAPVVARRKGLDKSHYLYIAVIVAVVAGAAVGLIFGKDAAGSPSSAPRSST